MTYVAVLTLIASVVSVGYQSPVEKQVAAQASTGGIFRSENPSVDQRVAADLAASTAEMAGLAVASNVSNLSISLAAKAELAQPDASVLTKPQIVQLADMRGVSTYVTVAGDTAQSVAERYGVSADTVKWANNLSGDALSVGLTLSIPNVNGVLYTVRSGDTIESISRHYGANSSRIISYNDLEISGISPGQRIVIPGGIVPVGERPGAARPAPASSSSSSYASYSNASVAGNRYDYGYCTWYAYNRRAQLGRPIGSFWGNANTWDEFARGSGYAVSNVPQVGAVLQTNSGYYGHVAVVESVNADGSIRVSEMNYRGWNVTSTRDIGAGEAAGYNYIY